MSRDKTLEFFSIFYETCQAVLSSGSLPEILQQLVEKTAKGLEVKGSTLRLINQTDNRLELVASWGLSQEYLAKGPLVADRSIPETLEGKTIFIHDAFSDPRIQYRDALRAEGLYSILSVPVMAHSGAIGVLRLFTAEPREFTAEEIEFASALAEMGGLAIANARLFDETGIELESLWKELGIVLPRKAPKQEQQLRCFSIKPVESAKSLEFFRALHEITREVLSTRDSGKVMRLITDRVLELMQVKACALRLVNETTGELELLTARGLSETYLQKGPLHADKSVRETLEGVPVLIEDAGHDPRIEYPEAMTREGIASLLSLPIVAQHRVIGLLRLYTAEPRHFSQDEVAFLTALGEIAGIAIMDARLYEASNYDLNFWRATLSYIKKQPS